MEAFVRGKIRIVKSTQFIYSEAFVVFGNGFVGCGPVDRKLAPTAAQIRIR